LQERQLTGQTTRGGVSIQSPGSAYLKPLSSSHWVQLDYDVQAEQPLGHGIRQISFSEKKPDFFKQESSKHYPESTFKT